MNVGSSFSPVHYYACSVTKLDPLVNSGARAFNNVIFIIASIVSYMLQCFIKLVFAGYFHLFIFIQLIVRGFRSRVWQIMKYFVCFSFCDNRQSLKIIIIVIASALNFTFQNYFSLRISCFKVSLFATHPLHSCSYLEIFMILLAEDFSSSFFFMKTFSSTTFMFIIFQLFNYLCL